jgi:hypothetical protein
MDYLDLNLYLACNVLHGCLHIPQSPPYLWFDIQIQRSAQVWGYTLWCTKSDLLERIWKLLRLHLEIFHALFQCLQSRKEVRKMK